MYKAKWIGRITIGMFLSAMSFADEVKFSDAITDQQTAETVTLESLLAKSPYAPRWQQFDPAKAASYTSTLHQPIADIDFQDSSVLGRVSKLRNLSLLTLAETGGTRLFLGVNDDGLVGLHFIGIPKRGSDRYLSLARMPYLKNDEPDSNLQQSESQATHVSDPH